MTDKSSFEGGPHFSHIVQIIVAVIVNIITIMCA